MTVHGDAVFHVCPGHSTSFWSVQSTKSSVVSAAEDWFSCGMGKENKKGTVRESQERQAGVEKNCIGQS